MHYRWLKRIVLCNIIKQISGSLNENFNFNFLYDTYLKSIVKWQFLMPVVFLVPKAL